MPGLDLTTWLMVFLRASGLLAIFPLFSARNFPVQLRVALGVLLALLVAPGITPVSLAGLPLPMMILRMAGEVLAGLLLGFTSRMLFYSLDFAGGVIGSEMGLNLPAGLNPFGDTQSTAPGLILYYLAAIIFLTLDLHHWLLVAFQRSYSVLPVGGEQAGEALLVDVIKRTGQTFQIALRLAAPFIGVSFVLSTVLSILGRAVPQMNVFSESFAIRSLAGLLVFGMTCQLMAEEITLYLRRLPEDVLRVAQLLAGH